MKNNNRKKGGLVLLGVSLLLSLIGMKETKALDLNLKNEQPYNYTYTNNGKQYPFYLATNLDDNLPIFQERGNAEFVDTSTYIKRNERLFMEPFELNALYLTTNGEKASTENLDKRLAMQLYIFENFAKSNKDTISFSFDTNKYHQISEELLKQGKEMIEEKKFSYEVKQGEWTYIPKEWEGKYHIDDNCPCEIREEEDGFYIKGNRLGKFTTNIDIEDYKEDGYYFDSNHPTRSSYTEVVKPCTALTTLEINVVPAIFNIHFPSNQVGYDLEIASESLKNEQVVYNFKVHDDYDLKDFSITKKDGTKLTIDNNSFTMPNEDVYVNIEVSKKIHNIKVENSEGIEIDHLGNAKVGDTVKINVKVLAGYELINLYVNGKDINLKELSFIMPNEDVSITAKTKKKEYTIENLIKNVTIKINTKAMYNDLVKFSIIGNDFYEIESLLIIDEKGNEIKINNNSFIMPASNIKIKANVKEKKYCISFIDEKTNTKIAESIYVPAGDFYIPYYYDYDEIKIYDSDNKEIFIDDPHYYINKDITFVYSGYYYEDEEDDYYYEDIPNTYESGFEPLFGLLTIAMVFFLKKYLFA